MCASVTARSELPGRANEALQPYNECFPLACHRPTCSSPGRSSASFLFPLLQSCVHRGHRRSGGRLRLTLGWLHLSVPPSSLWFEVARASCRCLHPVVREDRVLSYKSGIRHCMQVRRHSDAASLSDQAMGHEYHLGVHGNPACIGPTASGRFNSP